MIYKVRDPSGQIRQIQGPDGASDEEIIAAAKNLFGGAGEGPNIPQGLVEAQPRRAGGPGYKEDAYVDLGQQPNYLDFSDEELNAIQAVAGGDPQKEHFLKLVPTIEWRGNADAMRSGAMSEAGALGPYQFIDSTADAFGVNDRNNFEDAVTGAGRYYEELKKQYGGNLPAMLAAYNGGTAAGKAVTQGQAPPAEETQEYLKLAQTYGGGGPTKRFVKERPRSVTGLPKPESRVPPAGDTKPKGYWDYDPTSELNSPHLNEAQNRQAQAIYKAALPTADAATMLVTGIFGQIVGGVGGLAVALTGGGSEKAAETVAEISDFLTWSPKTEGLQTALKTVSPYMQNVDTFIKDSAMFVARGNPEIAATLETGGNALFLLGTGGIGTGLKTGARATMEQGLKQGIKAGAKEMAGKSTAGVMISNAKAVRAQEAIIKNTVDGLLKGAKDLGIELDRRTIHDTVQKAAEGMASVYRGQGGEEVARRLIAKNLEEKAALKKAWQDFRATEGFVDISWATKTADKLAEDLAGRGFAIDSPLIQGALDDLAGLNTRINTKLKKGTREPREAPANLRIKAQSLNEIQAVRERLRVKRSTARGQASPEEAAINEIRQRFDEMLQQQFDNDIAKGLEGPAEAWMKARSLTNDFKTKWNENVAISKIISKPGITSEEVTKFILGTNSMVGGTQAARTFEQIMLLTGNDAGVREAIRANVMFDVIKPLLGDAPLEAGNFRAVANNITKLTQQNNALVDALGLSRTDLRALQHGSRTAQHTAIMTAEGRKGWTGLFTQIFTRLTMGHEIAKAGLRVQLGQRVLNHILGQKKSTHNEMLKEFANISQEPLSNWVHKNAMTSALVKGKMAEQYQNLAEYGDDY